MNVNIIGTSTDNYDYLELLSVNGFCSNINIFTRLSKNQQQLCSDRNVFIKINNNNNNTFNNVNAGVLLTDITDHFATVVSIPIITMNLKVLSKS